jgi:predicted short-subunit dehydrogenase-like oxidoreductase (DUF2520 family)
MRILVFGAGRVGSSITRYARHLGADVSIVTRLEAAADPSSVRERISQADVVAAAIPDDRLSGWRENWRAALDGRRAVHFSGALAVPGMLAYHPLYSFPREPLAPEIMAGIAIAREEGAPPFSSILPGAPNPDFEVKAADRAFYHSLAVLSGNFAAHLWNEAAKAFAGRFGLPPEGPMAYYLAGVVERFRENPANSMTGPVARKDAETVARNLAALESEPRLKALYLGFLESAWPDHPAVRR